MIRQLVIDKFQSAKWGIGILSNTELCTVQCGQHAVDEKTNIFTSQTLKIKKNNKIIKNNKHCRITSSSSDHVVESKRKKKKVNTDTPNDPNGQLKNILQIYKTGASRFQQIRTKDEYILWPFEPLSKNYEDTHSNTLVQFGSAKY